jgi:nucleoside-diphosphate-sugar epimerase
MNILVIGSQGFIGTHLCSFFVHKSYTVVGADVLEVPANLTYEYVKVSRLSAQWNELLQIKQFDVCINAAGSGNVAYSVTHPLIDFEANTLDVIQLLDAIKTHQPTCKYIHLSSAAVYGNPLSLPIFENSHIQPISPYGYHKQMSEIICKEYSHLFNLKIAIIRPFSIFGNGLRKQLIWDMCNKFNSNDVITLFGTGNETRDFIHISDFVQLIEIVLEHADFNCTVYNAASGIETKVSDVANIFVEYYGCTKSVFFNGVSKPGDPQNWCANIESVSNIGFMPTANFANEITAYINWFNKLHARN